MAASGGSSSTARATAMTCIRRYNDPELDADQPHVVDAYMSIRAFRERVGAAELKKALQKSKVDFMRSAEQNIEYYVVPRSNFEGKAIPDALKDNEMTAAELAEYDVLGDGTFDLTEVFVVDLACPRGILGKRVRKLIFKHKAQQRITLQRGDVDAAPRLPASSATPTSVEGTAGGGTVPQANSQARQEKAVVEERPKKIARVLARQVSASSGEEGQREEENLASLESKIEAAAAAKRFYCEGSAGANTVHSWASVVVDACAQTPADGASACRKTLVQERFPKFLAAVLLDSECYACLQHFVTLFAKLQEQGAVVPMTVLLFDRLAKHSIKSESAISLEGTTLRTRMRFLESVLYKDYQVKWCEARLATAAAATADPELRQKCLLEVRAAQSENSTIVSSLSMATALFDHGIGPSERIGYALGGAERIRFACEWGASEEYECLMDFVETPGSWDSVAWETFEKGARTVIEHGHVSLVTNPVAQSILETAASLEASCGKHPWSESLFRHYASVRCAAPVWVQGAASPPDAEALGTHLGAVIKSCVKLLGQGDIELLNPYKQALRERKQKAAATKPEPQEQKANAAKLEVTSPSGGMEAALAAKLEVTAPADSMETLPQAEEEAPKPSTMGAASTGDDGGKDSTAAVAAVKVGDTVIAAYTKGEKKKYNGVKAKVDSVLSKAVWVEFMDEGALKGQRAKIPMSNVTIVSSNPASSVGETCPVSLVPGETSPPRPWQSGASLFGGRGNDLD